MISGLNIKYLFLQSFFFKTILNRVRTSMHHKTRLCNYYDNLFMRLKGEQVTIVIDVKELYFSGHVISYRRVKCGLYQV